MSYDDIWILARFYRCLSEATCKTLKKPLHFECRYMNEENLVKNDFLDLKVVLILYKIKVLRVLSLIPRSTIRMFSWYERCLTCSDFRLF